MLYEISKGSGRHVVLLRFWNTGNGWVGSLTGGDTPHVGSVVLAVPRTSLTGQGRSADLWRVPVPGHLDYEAAAPIAKCLCQKLGVPVSLTAGIHIDSAEQEDINKISANCEAALNALLEMNLEAKVHGVHGDNI